MGKSRADGFLLALVVVVILAATAIIATGIFLSNQQGSVPLQPTAASSFDSVNGLNLTLSLSSVSIKQGQVVNIVIDLTNTLDHNQTLTKVNHWPSAPGLTLTVCPNVPYPLGVAIYRGHFTNQNISAAASLWMFTPAPCPLYVLAVDGYRFLPNSNLAFPVFDNSTSTSQPMRMGADFILSGYYVNGALKVFPVGEYTVVSGTMFGDIAILHFTVT